MPLELQQLSPSLWSQHDFDTGFINCTPYRATLKEGVNPVYHKQYPLSREKIESIRPMIQEFLKNGILEPVVSPYSTPINPVSKPDGSVRFVQDLRAINNLIVPIAPIVPDVTQLLSAIPSAASHFSVIDLRHAFFLRASGQ